MAWSTRVVMVAVQISLRETEKCFKRKCENSSLKKNYSMLWLLISTVKINNIMKLWKKKKFMLILLSHRKLQKLHLQWLVTSKLTWKRHYNLQVEDKNRKYVPNDSNLLFQKILILYEDFSKGYLKWVISSSDTDSEISLDWIDCTCQWRSYRHIFVRID